jgi:hypothetical protein
VRADEEGLRCILVADAADDGTATGVIEGKDAQQVLESTREAVWVIVRLGVGIAELSGGREDDMFPGLNINAGIDPGFVAGQLHLLRDAFLAGWGLGTRSVLLRGRNCAFTDELGVECPRDKGRNEGCFQANGRSFFE